MGSKKHKKHHKSDRKERHECHSNECVEEDVNLYESKPDKIGGLKLILKVGGSSTPEYSDSPGPSYSTPPSYNFVATEDPSLDEKVNLLEGGKYVDRHKKSKKKKKKKEKDKERHEKKHKHHHKEKEYRKHDLLDSSQEDLSLTEESLTDPPAKRFAPASPTDPSSREIRTCVLKQRQERKPFLMLLEHFLHVFEKKDPDQFFAWPVTDTIAPGYSAIIQHPMDFSTMRTKISNNEYDSLGDFMNDFKLMCNNAMVYNRPGTVYYKAAKKLLHVGTKMISREKLLSLRHDLPFMAEINPDELGPHYGYEGIINNGMMGNDDVPLIRESRKSKPKPSKFEAIPDDMTPEEILAIARQAAQGAADRLTLERPNSKFGFLRQRSDGTTSLAILNPSMGDMDNQTVNLGSLVGKLTHGTGNILGFREDRRNIAYPVKHLYYGSFNSFAPSYDSTFSNLSKEESDLVLSTYGDETGVQYAESLKDFTKDCDYTVSIVDNLLDVLTNGEHSRTSQIIQERQRMKEEEERVIQSLEGSNTLSGPLLDIKEQTNSWNEAVALKSLQDLGIDISVLEEFERATGDDVDARERLQTQLSETSLLIHKLEQAQQERLSSQPPPHLAQVSRPNQAEVELAEKVSQQLKELAKQLPPSAVVSTPSVRRALGIYPPPVLHRAVPIASPSGPQSSSQGMCTGSTAERDIESELKKIFGETDDHPGVSERVKNIESMLADN